MNDLFNRTDEELVALYAEGNNEAFDVLLKRHQARTFNYIFYIVKDKELANDIFQETFVKAIMTIKQGRYTENGKFPAWISRIAHNLIIDFFRQEKADNYIISDNENMDIFNRKELSEGTVEDALVHSQIEADIRKLIKALPHSQHRLGAHALCHSQLAEDGRGEQYRTDILKKGRRHIINTGILTFIIYKHQDSAYEENLYSQRHHDSTKYKKHAALCFDT